MTNQRYRKLISFHRSTSMPCPYLDGRQEQQLFAELSGPDAQADFEYLSNAGFRRSHHIVYRPICKGCSACIPVRIRVGEFKFSRSWKRILKKNTDIYANNCAAHPTSEQFSLFYKYVQSRHGDGEMARMNRRDYDNLIGTSPVKSLVREYRNEHGELVGTCLLDQMQDGSSAVYSFFDPEQVDRSFGSYIILDLILQAKLHDQPYVYLGYWVKDSPKMDYKLRFKPLDGFTEGKWISVE